MQWKNYLSSSKNVLSMLVLYLKNKVLTSDFFRSLTLWLFVSLSLFHLYTTLKFRELTRTMTKNCNVSKSIKIYWMIIVQNISDHDKKAFIFFFYLTLCLCCSCRVLKISNFIGMWGVWNWMESLKYIFSIYLFWEV